MKTVRAEVNRLKFVVLLVGFALGILIGAVLPARAQLVSWYSRDSWVVGDNEVDFLPSYPNAALAAALNVGGRIMHPDRPFTVRAVSIAETVAGGGGAGSTVVTVTDGTNNCTATLACSNGVGRYRIATAGACSFAKGANLSASVTTAGCTTTQPTASSLIVSGRWEQ